jgi:hypothetical protein
MQVMDDVRHVWFKVAGVQVSIKQQRQGRPTSVLALVEFIGNKPK